MKNKIFILLAIFFSTSNVFAYDSSNTFMDEYMKKSASYYQHLKTCTPYKINELSSIAGKSGNYCKLLMNMKAFEQIVPYQECNIPLSKAYEYGNAKLNEINQGKLRVSSDDLKQYCKVLHNTIKTKDGTVSF